MTTFCTLVLTAIVCTVAPDMKLTPAQAAAILAPHQFVATPQYPREPFIYVSQSSVTAGPYGELPHLYFYGAHYYTSSWPYALSARPLHMRSVFERSAFSLAQNRSAVGRSKSLKTQAQIRR